MPLRLKIGVFFLLSAFLAQVIFSMREKSPTVDEFAHNIASGYSHLMTRNFKMIPGSPPLPRLLSAIPLYFLKARLPLDHISWQQNNSPEFATQFFHHYNQNMDEMVFWARIPIAILSVLLGLCVFMWSKTLFGAIGAFTSLVLYCFCPDIIAHSGLSTADLSVTLFFFLTLAYFWSYLKKPSCKHLVLTGVVTGLAFLSKFSAVLIFPTLLIIAFVSKKTKEISLLKIFSFLVVCFFTVWAGYFFELKPLLKDTPDPAKKAALIEKLGGKQALSFAESTPIPLATFGVAFTSMMFTRAQGTNAYLMGEWSRHGWWYYYLVAFLIKNSIPFVLFSVLALVFFKKLGLDKLTTAIFYVPIAVFFVVTLNDKAQAGIRYFLPIYPLLFVLAGGVVMYFFKKGKIFKWLMIFLLAWHAAEAFFIYPDYLAYFNEWVGGPKNGYKYLRDSNIDWGQDLKGLGAYVKKEGFKEVALYYYGPVDPGYYGIHYRVLSPSEFKVPQKTVYAVSVHHLDTLEWTAHTLPTQRIGYSMYVYDLR